MSEEEDFNRALSSVRSITRRNDRSVRTVVVLLPTTEAPLDGRPPTDIFEDMGSATDDDEIAMLRDLRSLVTDHPAAMSAALQHAERDSWQTRKPSTTSGSDGGFRTSDFCGADRELRLAVDSVDPESPTVRVWGRDDCIRRSVGGSVRERGISRLRWWYFSRGTSGTEDGTVICREPDRVRTMGRSA